MRPFPGFTTARAIAVFLFPVSRASFFFSAAIFLPSLPLGVRDGGCNCCSLRIYDLQSLQTIVKYSSMEHVIEMRLHHLP